MADNNRNQGRNNRSSEQDWNKENNQGKNWYDRGNGNVGRHENSGNNARYNQQQEGNYGNSDSGSNRYNKDHNSGNFGDEGQNYGYGGREFGSSYGGGAYQGNGSNSGSSDNTPSYGSSRNLYDRGYENSNRETGRGQSNVGAGNYGDHNADRGRRSHEDNRNTGATNYSGNYYGQRSGHTQGDSNDRSWWDRTRDEVNSWFGDNDAEQRRERDERQNHKGKGPKNYKRSDERIKEDINDRLSDDHWIDASEIDVSVNNGEVTLTGTVHERNHKRRAEDIAESVSGVKHVEVRLRVGKREESTVTGSSIGNEASNRSPSDGDDSAVQSGVTGTTATGTSEKSNSKSNYVNK